ncbi:hypothetical protein [Kitasatospora sp. NPDC094011]|uniref:hypothetical protein n=1 Tax=Kitasatospora sp. NPDC094011 TaxID=3364090 RepID=UPI0038267ED9
MSYVPVPPAHAQKAVNAWISNQGGLPVAWEGRLDKHLTKGTANQGFVQGALDAWYDHAEHKALAGLASGWDFQSPHTT